MNHSGLCKTDTKQAVNRAKALQITQKIAEPILFHTLFIPSYALYLISITLRDRRSPLASMTNR